MHHKYLIIGAGPTGMGAAYRLKELGETDFKIIEAHAHVGGLATTFRDEKGFLWDIGGHVQFSHYNYFDELMLKAIKKENWLNHQRESWVWMRNRFIPYPFQNNIKYLPKEDLWKALEGLISNASSSKKEELKNFEDWIFQSFGEGIANIFMKPYNYKVWAYPPSQMNYKWIGERVATVDLKRITENVIFDKEDRSWGPNNTFQFPLEGGTGQIWNNVADLIGKEYFSLNKRLTQLDPIKKRLFFQDGTEATYEYLLSTIPIDKLSSMCTKHIKEDISVTSRLKHSSSHIIGIGLKGRVTEELKTKCWMYFPENNCPFYRVTVFSNYSPNNVPDPEVYWSLMTETSESPEKLVNRDGLIEETIQGLLNTGLIQSRDQIVSKWHYTAEYGYPTPSLERDQVIRSVIPTLEQYDIYSRGRFGAWLYEVSNQDHSLMQGVEWANRIVLKIPEITFNYPSVANANLGRLV
ncbi:MAG: FAD-dependent oxidoreductase [Flavobacteriales bacterium]|nr:FAD-dependent oxidoreductase [Flavobacteriales bacterium]